MTSARAAGKGGGAHVSIRLRAARGNASAYAVKAASSFCSRASHEPCENKANTWRGHTSFFSRWQCCGDSGHAACRRSNSCSTCHIHRDTTWDPVKEPRLDGQGQGSPVWGSRHSTCLCRQHVQAWWSSARSWPENTLSRTKRRCTQATRAIGKSHPIPRMHLQKRGRVFRRLGHHTACLQARCCLHQTRQCSSTATP